MSDPNAPSWLTADNAPSAPAVAAPGPDAEKPAKASVFKMFSKEAATAQVQKSAVGHVTTQAQNITTAPDDGFTPAWATASAYTPPHDIENGSNAAQPAPSGPGPVPLDIDPALLKRMQFYHTILRSAYMSAAILMGTSAGLSLVNQTNVSAAFFAIYVMFFCLLMCCFEIGLNVSTPFIPFFLSSRQICYVYCPIISFTYCDFINFFPADDFFLHRHQLWLPVHSYRTNYFPTIRRIHEFQFDCIWQSCDGRLIPCGRSPCADYVQISQIFGVCTSKRFLRIESK